MALPKAWDLEHTVADALVPRLRAGLMAAFTRAGERIDRRVLRAAYQAQSVAGVVEAVNAVRVTDSLLADLRTIYRRLLRDAAEATMRELQVRKATLGEMGMRFDVTNPFVVEWIDRNARDLLLQLGVTNAEAVKAMVRQMFVDGITVDEAERRLRELVGMTPQHARALETFRATLVEQGLSPSRIVALTDTYATRLKRYRATMIARTETIRAAAEGQRQLWLQARDEGLLEEDRTLRQWGVTPDERLCPICAPLRGERVGLDQEFSIGVLGPPAHPQCRCFVSLVFADESGRYPNPPADVEPGKGIKRPPLKPKP